MRRCGRRQQQGPIGRRGDGERAWWSRGPPTWTPRRQQGGGAGTARSYGTRGANPNPGRAADSDRARLDDAGLGDHLMMGKELEKSEPVGEKILFLRARTVASLLASSIRCESYPGWFNHPTSTKLDAGSGRGNRALKRDSCATATNAKRGRRILRRTRR